MPAAGAFGYGEEYRDLVDTAALGAVVTNPVSLYPRQAANGRRIAAHGQHLVVHTGLPNHGLKGVLHHYRKLWERLPIPVIVHLIATTPAEMTKAAALLSGVQGVGGIELGLAENIHEKAALDLLDAARAEGDLPVIVRVPFSRVDALAPALANAGADALTLTAPPRAVLPVPDDALAGDAPPGDASPSVARYMRGRLYSAALFPLLLNFLARWADKLSVPVIACGGIASTEDALACISLGAAAVQIDALLWRDPALLTRIATEVMQEVGKSEIRE